MPAPTSDSPRVAYFCMEYGLDDRLRTYSGGLGILAGDTLKAAHDLGVPMVALGIRWAQGYTKQTISDDGRQVDVYEDYPAEGVLEDTGVEVTVEVRGDSVRCKVWKAARFGNVPLYLLDTDLDGNPHRDTTARLYGGGPEARVAQEVVLGVGGVRALRALGLDVDLYHFNEGHALLAAFELVREKTEGGASYDDALAAVHDEVVFTTHTPVLAGNETHPVERLREIADPPLTDGQLEALGGRPFNMTVAALKLAGRANAVAELHAQTANRMWDFVDGRPHILPITNGVHRPTWVDDAMLDAAETGGDLWGPHLENKRALADFVEERTGQTLDPGQPHRRVRAPGGHLQAGAAGLRGGGPDRRPPGGRPAPARVLGQGPPRRRGRQGPHRAARGDVAEVPQRRRVPGGLRDADRPGHDARV